MDRAERQYKPGERVPGTEYVVVRLEAEGGHGALYLVRHHFLEKKVQMLKTLRSIEPSTDLVERLKREAQMLASIRHPGVVEVRGKGLMLAAELESADLAKTVLAKLLDRRILVNRTDETVLRFLPPYLLQREHVDTTLAAIDDILTEQEAASSERSQEATLQGGR